MDAVRMESPHEASRDSVNIQPSWRRSLRSSIAAAVLALAFVMMTSCISPQVSSHLDYAQTRGFEAPVVDARSAVVVFLRPDDIRVFSSSILDGDEFVTLLTERTHFVYWTQPGTHRFMSHTTRHGPSYVDAELEAGKVYFVAVKWLESGLSGWMQLIPICPDEEYWEQLPDWLADSRLVQPNETAMLWFEDKRVELLEEQAAKAANARITRLPAASGIDTVFSH